MTDTDQLRETIERLKAARVEGVELTFVELDALVGDDGWLHEPPDECEHGFSPPSRCPNEGCPDQHLATAWHKLRELRRRLLPQEEG